ncbi:hypothetical protein HDV05_003960, partial [Chytridiales sp. JEL 0842]
FRGDGGDGGGGGIGGLQSIPKYLPVTVSNAEWHNVAGHVYAAKKRAALLEGNIDVKDIIDNTPQGRTSDLATFQTFTEYILCHAETLFDHFKSHRSIRFDVYRREQKAQDTLVTKLVRGERDTTVFWGSGTTFFASKNTLQNLRGPPAPAKWFLRAVVRHHLVKRVVLVDEYRSSTIDPYTLTRVQHLPRERGLDGSAGYPIYSVLRSPNGGTIWNRDVMGAINIKIIAYSMSRGLVHPFRGAEFA